MKSQNKFLVYALLMFTVSGYSIAADKAKSIMNQFKDTLLCHQSPESLIFNTSPEAFAKEGITVTKISEYNPEYIYHFAKPLKMLNVTFQTVKYLGNYHYGFDFFAVAKGDMEKFAKSVGAKRTPAEFNDFRWKSPYVKYFTSTTDQEYFRRIFLIGREADSKPGEFNFGCYLYY